MSFKLQNTQRPHCNLCSQQYEEMRYVCADCGREETFDGMAVKARSPISADSDCHICDMRLVDAERYWSGEIEPDSVTCFARTGPSSSAYTDTGDANE